MYHFVPYTWRFNLIMKEFEFLTLANEWNWVDCFGHNSENGESYVVSRVLHCSLTNVACSV